MKKIIKRYGSGLVINFSVDECKAYGIKEGQIYDIEMSPINDIKINVETNNEDA